MIILSDIIPLSYMTLIFHVYLYIFVDFNKSKVCYVYDLILVRVVELYICMIAAQRIFLATDVYQFVDHGCLKQNGKYDRPTD